MNTGQRKLKPTGIRFPESLRKKLDEQAAANGRSRNSEVLVIVSKALNVKLERRAA